MAGSAGTVVIEVRADTTKAVADINRAASRAVTSKVKLDADTGQLTSKVSTAAAKANRDLGGISTSKAEAQVKRLGDTFERELGHQSGVISQLGGSLVGVGAGATYLGGRMIASLKPAVDEASALNDTVSYSQVVFGEQASAVERFGEGAAKALGLSKRQAIDGATAFAGYAKQAGLAGDDVVAFSEKLVGLAADLGAARGTTTEDAISALTSGLRGENDPLERFNVLLSDAVVRQEAVRLKVAETTKDALTPQQRVLAVNSLLFKQTADAQGQFAREADSAAGSAKVLNAELNNAKADEGKGLLGLMTGVNKAATEVTDILGEKGTEIAGLGIFAAGATTALTGTVTSIIGAGAALKRMRGDGSGVGKELGGLGDVAEDTGDDLEDMGKRGSRGITLLAGAGKVLAAAGISEAIFGIANSVRGTDRELDDAINRTVIAAREGGTGVVTAFTDAVNDEGSKLSLSGLWERFGTEFRLGGQGVVADIEHIQKTFDNLLNEDPQGAQALIDQVRLLDQALPKTSTDFIESEKILDAWQGQLDNSTGAQEALTGAVQRGGNAVGDATGKVIRYGVELDATASKAEQYGAVLSGIFAPSDDALSANDALADGQQRVLDARRKLTEAESGTSDALVSARKALVDADKQLTEAIEGNADKVEDAERRVREAERSLQEAEEAGAAKASGGVDVPDDRPDLSVARDIAAAKDALDDARGDLAEAKRGDDIAAATERRAEALRKVNEEQAKVGPNSEAARQAAEDYEDAQRAIPGLVRAAEEANARLREEYEQNPDAIQKSIDKIDEWTKRGLISVDTARQWKEELLGALGAAQGIADLDTLTGNGPPPLHGAGPTQPGQTRVPNSGGGTPPPLAGSGPTQQGQARSAPTAADFLNSFPKNPRVGQRATVGGQEFFWDGTTWKVAPSVSFGFGAGRALGGPVYGNTIHPVNEKGVPELYTAAGGAQFLLPTDQGGQVTPLKETSGAGNGDVVAAIRALQSMLVGVIGAVSHPPANVAGNTVIVHEATPNQTYMEVTRALSDASYGRGR